MGTTTRLALPGSRPTELTTRPIPSSPARISMQAVAPVKVAVRSTTSRKSSS